MRRLPWAGPLPSATALGRLGPGRSGRRLCVGEGAPPGWRERGSRPGRRRAPVGVVHGARGADVRREPGGGRRATVAFAGGLAGSTGRRRREALPGDRTGVAQHRPDGRRARRQPTGDRPLRPRAFRAAIAGGVPIVMISNATYPALDSKPAPWSTKVQSLLRDDLGFRGVTISDALDGAAATRGRALASVAALAAEAGVDLLLLTGSEASSAAAFERVAGGPSEAGSPARPSRRAIAGSWR